MKPQFSFFVSAAFLTCVLSVPANASIGTILQDVDGAQAVTVMGSDGTQREAKAGDPLETGDDISTASNVAVTIAYEKGAQVTVSTNSKVQIVDDSQETADAKTPTLFLKEGDIRAVVDTGGSNIELSAPSPGASSAPTVEYKPHKFLIRTTTAVMGVRGTDFIVSTKGDGRPSLNTLSGTVEYAEDIKSFQSSSMVSVSAGHALGTNGAKPFEVDEFAESFNKKHPQADALYKKSKQELKNGRLAQKFMFARAAGAHGLMPASGLTGTAPSVTSPVNPGDAPSVITFPGKKKVLPSPKPSRVR